MVRKPLCEFCFCFNSNRIKDENLASLIYLSPSMASVAVRSYMYVVILLLFVHCLMLYGVCVRNDELYMLYRGSYMSAHVLLN